jgi:hypothetical protein
MTTIGEEAQKYEPKGIKNISELPEINTDLTLLEDTGTAKDGSTYKYKYIELNGDKYRVPGVVLGQIKLLKAEMPGFKRFKVKKAGEGKTGTEYTVIPIIQ